MPTPLKIHAVSGITLHQRGDVHSPDRCAQEGVWAGLTPEEREAGLNRALTGFLDAGRLHRDSVRLEALENDVSGRPVRAVLSFMADCVADHDALPRFIRRLEKFIRMETKAPIEVLAGERQDRNKMRRMIVVPRNVESS